MEGLGKRGATVGWDGMGFLLPFGDSQKGKQSLLPCSRVQGLVQTHSSTAALWWDTELTRIEFLG